MIDSVCNLTRSIVSNLYSLCLEGLSLPIKLFSENYWFAPSVSSSLREIADRFKCRKDFYDYCITHHIKIENIANDKITSTRRIDLNDIRPGDTVLLSAPAQCCDPSYKELASPELLANLDLAESLIQYVQKKVPHTANYLSKSFTKDDPLHKDFFASRSKYAAWPSDPDALKVARRFVRRIKERKMGVCQELALVGMIHAWKKHPDQSVEMVFMLGGCHLFLVINREEDSDPLDYRTWGENCVICDPWAGKCYPVAKLEEELFDFLGELRDDYEGSDMAYPYVRRFDPQTQKVVVCFEPLSKEDRALILAENAESVDIKDTDPSLFD